MLAEYLMLKKYIVMVPLFDLEEGEQGEIAEISSPRHHGKPKCKGGIGHRHHRFTDLGIRVGKTITLLQKTKRGPVLVRVDDARIALGRGMAEKIKIKDSPSQHT